jgi:2-phosphoglycerate kinase
MTDAPPWNVYLIGGASGVGKTRVSYRVARHLGIGITEIDDFQNVLERMTTPEQYPAVHLFNVDPDAFFQMDDQQKLDHAIAYGSVMARALEPVIANRLQGGPSVVLEGDFLLPALAAQPTFDDIPANGHVRAVFIYEEDPNQIARNYLAREGDQGERAYISWRYSEWLRQEAARLGIPTVAARPWKTGLERTLAALQALHVQS